MALNARLSPLKSIGTGLLDAAIWAGHVLYPESTGSATVLELSKKLLASEERLRAWRSSSARAGADWALSFVLSLYEEINIDTVRALRTSSPWLNDPKFIKRWQAAADYFADYAVTKYLFAGRVYDDLEDEDIVEEAGSEEDDAASSSEEQYVDAEEPSGTEAPEPRADTTTEAATTEIATTAAAGINADAATDISVDPSTETPVQPASEAAYDDADP